MCNVRGIELVAVAALQGVIDFQAVPFPFGQSTAFGLEFLRCVNATEQRTPAAVNSREIRGAP